MDDPLKELERLKKQEEQAELTQQQFDPFEKQNEPDENGGVNEEF